MGGNNWILVSKFIHATIRIIRIRIRTMNERMSYIDIIMVRRIFFVVVGLNNFCVN